MNNSNLRLCIVIDNKLGGSKKKAYFHRWAEQTRCIVKAQEPPKDTAPYFSSLDEVIPVSSTMGIVEYEDGTVKTVEPDQIKFIEPARLTYDLAPQTWHEDVIKNMSDKLKKAREQE